MKGAILENQIELNSSLNVFLPIINERIISYNWLLTDIDSDYYSNNIIKNNYEFLSGQEFLDIISKNEFRFVWGVFSGFSKEISLEEILSEKLPFANGYTGFWKNPISIQHPLAITEMVLWDGILALFISHNDDIIDKFLNYYKSSKNLEKYNDEIYKYS